MSKALNSFFSAIYLIIFIIGAGVCIYYAVANSAALTVYGDNILYAILVLVAAICSSAIHWDARETKKPQLRHRVFLGMTVVNFISFVWLAATILNCSGDICASNLLVPFVTTIFIWILTFSFGVTIFMKLTESGMARIFAILFSLGAVFWSLSNIQQNTPFWAFPLGLAIIGIICAIFAPYLTRFHKHHR